MGEISHLYGDQGYAFVNTFPITETDADAKIVDITFDIQKGDKVYYERINVVGNTKTRDKVIRRELRIYEPNKRLSLTHYSTAA